MSVLDTVVCVKADRLSRYFVGSGSLAGVKVVGLGFRSEEEGLAIPRVVDDEELDELNEGVSGLGIQP